MTRVLMLGLMGTGKTTVGRRVADSLGWPYLDNDDLVGKSRGAALEKLKAAEGGDELHEAETEALLAALAAAPPLVAGVAGYAVVPDANRAAIREADAHAVWLRARPETLVERIGDDVRRPWLQPDPLAVLTAMARERAAAYEDAADLIVDVDDLDPAAVTECVLAGLGRTRAPV